MILWGSGGPPRGGLRMPMNGFSYTKTEQDRCPILRLRLPYTRVRHGAMRGVDNLIQEAARHEVQFDGMR